MDLQLDIKIVERQPIKVLSTRGMAAASNKFEERYKTIYREAFAKKLKVEGAPIAIYHNMHFDGQIDDLEVALPVDKNGEGVKELPGGTCACAVHHGPYSTLPITYLLLGAWISHNGYEVCGAPYDLYIRGGNDKILSPEQYLTEVYMPVRKMQQFSQSSGKVLGSIAT